MSFIPSVDDLRLVSGIHRHGSIGAAARELLIGQPSASARLASLERRLGTALFDRDTTGARATDAGRAFAAEADHVLSHLSELPERVRAGATAPLLRVATFPSLAALMFPALDAVLAELNVDIQVHQHVDHGDTLVDLVAEGSIDMAVLAIADQLPLPARVMTAQLGTDDLAVLSPVGVPIGRGRRPFSGVVPYHSVDLNGQTIEQRITALGGQPRRCATGEVAVRTARDSGQPALLARAIAEIYRAPDEQVSRAPFRLTFAFQVVTRAPAPGLVAALVPHLAARMGLAETTVHA